MFKNKHLKEIFEKALYRNFISLIPVWIVIFLYYRPDYFGSSWFNILLIDNQIIFQYFLINYVNIYLQTYVYCHKGENRWQLQAYQTVFELSIILLICIFAHLDLRIFIKIAYGVNLLRSVFLTIMSSFVLILTSDLKPKIILHIPHSSKDIPHYKGFLLGDKKDEKIITDKIEDESKYLCDTLSDKLFSRDYETIVKADFSRVFCDVERFADDEKEEMAKKGMGVLYETFDDGEKMREISEELRNEILEEYYYPHHEKLTEAVEHQLKKHGKAIIIDCHTFPDKPFKRDTNQNTPRPDICIGTDDFHTSQSLIEFTVDYFKKHGYTVELNTPYSGTIVPEEFYRKNKNVMSIMIEVNKKLILYGNFENEVLFFKKLKKEISDYILMLKKRIKKY